MIFSETPILYRSPGENGSSSGGYSRDESYVGLLSPMPDLTETVNALNDPYTPATPSCRDQSWPSSSFYGYHQAQPAHAPGQQDGMADPLSFDHASGTRSGQVVSPPYGFKDVGAMYTGGYDNQSQETTTNPFSTMSTAMLQSYLAGNRHHFNAVAPSSVPDVLDVGLNTTHSASGMTTTGSLYSQHMADVRGHTTQPALLPERSPSPLLEVGDEELESMSPSSSEDVESSRLKRRASDGGEPIKMVNGYPRRMSANLPIEEKLRRAAATEGLSKQDKRRVQNKLAQRAFRARSKVANRNVFGRLEHLEELTATQADRIVKMTDLISRLQKENTGLKTAKFQETLAAMHQT